MLPVDSLKSVKSQSQGVNGSEVIKTRPGPLLDVTSSDLTQCTVASRVCIGLNIEQNGTHTTEGTELEAK